MLNELETITGVYEDYVGRDPFCMQYILTINSKLMPGINKISGQLNNYKGKKSFSPVLAKRHSDISLRFSKAMFKLSDSMGKMKMCEPDQVKK
jgi:hypothetical protein